MMSRLERTGRDVAGRVGACLVDWYCVCKQEQVLKGGVWISLQGCSVKVQGQA